MKDAYQIFFSFFKISDEELIQWGIQEAIFPDYPRAAFEWDKLKKRVLNNERVYIRGYGRNAHGTYLYQDLYTEIIGNDHITKDPTNNTIPHRIMEKMTGLCRNRDIYNYQVSHIFGKTKNPFLFEAPWNLCYMPKMMDPFTGHESKGELSNRFQKLFRQYSFDKYRPLIEDYNQLIIDLNLRSKAMQYLEKLNNRQFSKDVLPELSTIMIEL